MLGRLGFARRPMGRMPSLVSSLELGVENLWTAFETTFTRGRRVLEGMANVQNLPQLMSTLPGQAPGEMSQPTWIPVTVASQNHLIAKAEEQRGRAELAEAQQQTLQLQVQQLQAELCTSQGEVRTLHSQVLPAQTELKRVCAQATLWQERSVDLQRQLDALKASREQEKQSFRADLEQAQADKAAAMQQAVRMSKASAQVQAKLEELRKVATEFESLVPAHEALQQKSTALQRDYADMCGRHSRAVAHNNQLLAQMDKIQADHAADQEKVHVLEEQLKTQAAELASLTAASFKPRPEGAVPSATDIRVPKGCGTESDASLGPHSAGLDAFAQPTPCHSSLMPTPKLRTSTEGSDVLTESALSSSVGSSSTAVLLVTVTTAATSDTGAAATGVATRASASTEELTAASEHASVTACTEKTSAASEGLYKPALHHMCQARKALHDAQTTLACIKGAVAVRKAPTQQQHPALHCVGQARCAVRSAVALVREALAVRRASAMQHQAARAASPSVTAAVTDSAAAAAAAAPSMTAVTAAMEQVQELVEGTGGMTSKDGDSCTCLLDVNMHVLEEQLVTQAIELDSLTAASPKLEPEGAVSRATDIGVPEGCTTESGSLSRVPSDAYDAMAPLTPCHSSPLPSPRRRISDEGSDVQTESADCSSVGSSSTAMSVVTATTAASSDAGSLSEAPSEGSGAIALLTPCHSPLPSPRLHKVSAMQHPAARADCQSMATDGTEAAAAAAAAAAAPGMTAVAAGMEQVQVLVEPPYGITPAEGESNWLLDVDRTAGCTDQQLRELSRHLVANNTGSLILFSCKSKRHVEEVLLDLTPRLEALGIPWQPLGLIAASGTEVWLCGRGKDGMLCWALDDTWKFAKVVYQDKSAHMMNASVWIEGMRDLLVQAAAAIGIPERNCVILSNDEAGNVFWHLAVRVAPELAEPLRLQLLKHLCPFGEKPDYGQPDAAHLMISEEWQGDQLVARVMHMVPATAAPSKAMDHFKLHLPGKGMYLPFHLSHSQLKGAVLTVKAAPPPAAPAAVPESVDADARRQQYSGAGTWAHVSIHDALSWDNDTMASWSQSSASRPSDGVLLFSYLPMIVTERLVKELAAKLKASHIPWKPMAIIVSGGEQVFMARYDTRGELYWEQDTTWNPAADNSKADSPEDMQRTLWCDSALDMVYHAAPAVGGFEHMRVLNSDGHWHVTVRLSKPGHQKEVPQLFKTALLQQPAAASAVHVVIEKELVRGKLTGHIVHLVHAAAPTAAVMQLLAQHMSSMA